MYDRGSRKYYRREVTEIPTRYNPYEERKQIRQANAQAGAPAENSGVSPAAEQAEFQL